MNALFDTNVVLDVLLARAPFVTDSNACFLQVEDGQLRGYLGATWPGLTPLVSVRFHSPACKR